MTPKSNVAFTPEEDSKLIELVSNHPCLFDLENKFDKMPVKNKKTKQNDDLIEFLKKSSDERKEILNKINNDREEDPY